MNKQFSDVLGNLDLSEYESDPAALRRSYNGIQRQLGIGTTKSDNTRTQQKRRVRLRRGLLVAAAAILVLGIAGGVLAATLGFGQLREQAREAAENYNHEENLQQWKAVNWTPWAWIGMEDGNSACRFIWTELMLYKQSEPDFYLLPRVQYEADAPLRFLQTDFHLYANGVELPFGEDPTMEPQFSEAISENGITSFEGWFLYEDRFEPGTEFRMVGAARNEAGEIVSEMDITFTLTQAAVAEMTRRNAEGMAEMERSFVQSMVDLAEALPENAAQAGIPLGDVVLEEITVSEADHTLYYTVYTPANASARVNAYEFVRYGDIYAWADALPFENADGSYRTLYRAYLPTMHLRLDETVPITIFSTEGDDDFSTRGFALDYKHRANSATLAANAGARVTEAVMGLLGREGVSIPIGVTETVGDIQVTLHSLYQSAGGEWLLQFSLENNADYHTPQEYAPKLVRINGILCTPYGEYERYEFMDASTDGPTWVVWPLYAPLSLSELPDSFTLEIEWDIYDRQADRTAKKMGTFFWTGYVGSITEEGFEPGG